MGAREAARWLAAREPRRIAFVVDAGLRDAPGIAGVREWCEVADDVVELAVSGLGSVDDAQHLAARLDASDVVVACGGGSVLDRTKLARAVGAGVDVRAIRHATAGHVRLTLPQGGPPLLAAPTTIGTGSERNGNAVTAVGDRRVLVSGPALVPDLAVIDGRLTASLDRTAWLAGLYEALARTIEPFAGGRAGSAADQLALASVVRLAQFGERLLAGETLDAASREEAARLTGLSHTPAMQQGRDPFSFRSWYLAHELATATGLGKVACLAAVLPAVADRSRSGQAIWGSHARRQAIVERIGAVAGGTGDDAEPVMGALARRWGVAATTPMRFDRDAVTDRVLSAWGTPHLEGVSHDEVDRVLAAAQAALAGGTGRAPHDDC
ncbi:iron-containing alcohol dehydrogenase [Xylanimonas allomyrinae]|uniref:iron-containing alcohol dehydrogenase n=1 Tax=Xylanimonas allomyrinae TaxID=2509459 RepID=UPI0013A5FA34|nr:iron-containing alcohol dehydrogenase [Xylanimonas allomyrinae]